MLYMSSHRDILEANTLEIPTVIPITPANSPTNQVSSTHCKLGELSSVKNRLETRPDTGQSTNPFSDQGNTFEVSNKIDKLNSDNTVEVSNPFESTVLKLQHDSENSTTDPNLVVHAENNPYMEIVKKHEPDFNLSEITKHPKSDNSLETTKPIDTSNSEETTELVDTSNTEETTDLLNDPILLLTTELRKSHQYVTALLREKSELISENNTIQDTIQDMIHDHIENNCYIGCIGIGVGVCLGYFFGRR